VKEWDDLTEGDEPEPTAECEPEKTEVRGELDLSEDLWKLVDCKESELVCETDVVITEGDADPADECDELLLPQCLSSTDSVPSLGSTTTLCIQFMHLYNV